MEKIFEEVKKVIKSKYKIDVKLDTKISELGIDSLDLLDLMVDVEKKYKITIDDSKLLEIKTVKDIVDSVSTKL